MELKTNRLRIRTLSEDDWEDMKHIFADFNGSKHAVYDRPFPTMDTDIRNLVKQFAESRLFFAVHTQEENNMIGYVCFHRDGDAYDLGYCFRSDSHGKGYAYESTSALIRCMSERYGIRHFTAGTALNHIPSCRLLEKLGFTCVSTETVSFTRDFSFQGGNYQLILRPDSASNKNRQSGDIL